MKKNLTPYIIMTILFALFNVFAFAIPPDKTATFWVAYGFTVAMFFVEVIVFLMAFPKENTSKKQFLSWPLICVCAAYFIIQTVIFLPFKIFPNIPCWIAVIVHSLVLGVALICIIATQMSAKLISNFDKTHGR